MTETFPSGVQILVKEPYVDMATLKEVAQLREKPSFRDFIARDGLATIVEGAREKLKGWEESGELERAREASREKRRARQEAETEQAVVRGSSSGTG